MMGWIKLHRQITEWRWYTDPNTMRLFVHLLLKATRKPVELGEIELLPGQLITGRKVLADELRLSEQEIRTSLQKLKNSKNLTTKSTNKFSVITICKWDEYQVKDADDQPATQPTEQPASNQPATSQQPHTRSKEVKEVKKREKRALIPPTLLEVIEYFIAKGSTEKRARQAFEYYELGGWTDRNGHPVKNWKQKLNTNWINNTSFSQPERKSSTGDEEMLKIIVWP